MSILTPVPSKPMNMRCRWAQVMVAVAGLVVGLIVVGAFLF
jgi:hypothetical protein